MSTLHDRYGDRATAVKYTTRCACDALHIIEFVLPEKKNWLARVADKFKKAFHHISGAADEIEIPSYEPISYCPPYLDDVDPPCLDENADDVNADENPGDDDYV